MARIDLTGKRFGRLVVLSYTGTNSYREALYRCSCDCGVDVIVQKRRLLNSTIPSCGCIQREQQPQIGQIFGYLKVLKKIKNTVARKHTWYLCHCKCGNRKRIRTDRLLSGHSKSCGCVKYPGTYGERCLYAGYRCEAKSRGLKFELDREYFYALIHENCFYCGAPPKSMWEHKKSGRSMLYTGIDRINSNLSYVEDNVVSCCYACNWAKMGASVPDFLKHVANIYKHVQERQAYAS